MAHRHNRRRTRPCSRSQKTGLFADDGVPYGNVPTVEYSTNASPSARPAPGLANHLQTSASSVAARHWQNRYIAWQNREAAQRRELAKIQDQQLKLFGGEPGEDDELCLKMAEMFEGMEWVDSLN